MKQKDARLREINIHFLYVIIIAGIVIIGLLTALFFPSQKAQDFLSFAGVALSLVLSVIAILITLWDVAGQRQQVADITDSAKTLREIVEKQAENYQNLHASIEEIINNAIQEKMNSGFKELSAKLDNLELDDDTKNKINDLLQREFSQETIGNKSRPSKTSVLMKYPLIYDLTRTPNEKEIMEIQNIINNIDRDNLIDTLFLGSQIQLGYSILNPLPNRKAISNLNEINAKLNVFLKNNGLRHS
ncbi:hypothetical protein [Staphylococcus simulans]|uniref:hypothetical protein n=1 Tax=Staphylococcus simulans TaxID=1286 RepID=UPI0021D25A71|nr:hypothetical protein [Staphylococcus simulans]UXR49089.1 hypothetical protein MUA28_07995 [Staphylococcus simulans]